MKYLKYNEETGNVEDANGAPYYIGHSINAFILSDAEQAFGRKLDKSEPLSIKEILALKEQGFDANEIIEMRKEGII